MKIIIVDELSLLSDVLLDQISTMDNIEVQAYYSDLNPYHLQNKLQKTDLIIIGSRAFNERDLELISMIRSNKMANGIIAFSYNGVSDFSTRCKEAGADFYLSGNGEFRKLMELINFLSAIISEGIPMNSSNMNKIYEGDQSNIK